MKIPVSHYKKSDKELFWNGGCLYIENSKLVLRNLFKTVAVFSIDKIKFKELTDELIYKSVEISDNETRYTLLFTKSNYRKLSELLNLT